MGRRQKSMLSIDFAGGLDAVHTALAGAGLLMETYRQAGISALSTQARSRIKVMPWPCGATKEQAKLHVEVHGLGK